MTGVSLVFARCSFSWLQRPSRPPGEESTEKPSLSPFGVWTPSAVYAEEGIWIDMCTFVLCRAHLQEQGVGQQTMVYFVRKSWQNVKMHFVMQQ